ncbi:MAG: HIRAN domain-containing protein [Elusimicrobia bacterium]|nr:HIRAN domain-containing protein [Elusimicrobiota bacterium]
MELVILTIFGIAVIGLSSYFALIRERPKNINDYITGWKYYDGESVFPRLKTGDILHLMRQSDNPHDKYAVEIFSSEGIKLGFMSRVYSKVVSDALAAKRVVVGTITELNPPPEEQFKRVKVQVTIYGKV